MNALSCEGETTAERIINRVSDPVEAGLTRQRSPSTVTRTVVKSSHSFLNWHWHLTESAHAGSASDNAFRPDWYRLGSAKGENPTIPSFESTCRAHQRPEANSRTLSGTGEATSARSVTVNVASETVVVDSTAAAPAGNNGENCGADCRDEACREERSSTATSASKKLRTCVTKSNAGVTYRLAVGNACTPISNGSRWFP